MTHSHQIQLPLKVFPFTPQWGHGAPQLHSRETEYGRREACIQLSGNGYLKKCLKINIKITGLK